MGIIEDKKERNNLSEGQIFAVFHKIIPLVMLILGLFLGTMYVSSKVEVSTNGAFYTDTSGISYYYPWMIFVWASMYFKVPEIFSVIEKGYWIILAGVICAVIVYIILSYTRGIKLKASKALASGRWAKINDLKKAGSLFQDGTVVGQLNDAWVTGDFTKGSLELHCQKPSKLIGFPSGHHLIIYLPTRYGKGVSIIIPTLLNKLKGSLLNYDPKFENWNATAGFRRHFSRCYLFNATSKNTIKINLLMWIRRGDAAWRDASFIAAGLITPPGKSSTSDNAQHFLDSARRLATLAILHVVACDKCLDKTLFGVYKFLSSSSDNAEGVDALFEEMITSRHLDQVIHDQIVMLAKQFLMADPKERSGYFTTVYRAFEVFMDPYVKYATSENELYFEDFLEENGAPPVSLYLGVPLSDQDRLTPIYRLIVDYIIARIGERGTNHKKKVFKNAMTIVIEELPTMGRMDSLGKYLGALSGYGVDLILVAQDPVQMEDIYGIHHSFHANCRYKVFGTMSDIKSARMVSEYLGKKPTIQTTNGTSGVKTGFGLDQMNIGTSETTADLLTPDEVNHLDATTAILVTTGSYPYLFKKEVYYEDPRFKKKAFLPVPVTREQLMTELPEDMMAGKGGDKYAWYPKNTLGGGNETEIEEDDPYQFLDEISPNGDYIDEVVTKAGAENALEAKEKVKKFIGYGGV